MNEAKTFEEIFPSLEKGCMLRGEIPVKYQEDYRRSDMHKWS